MTIGSADDIRAMQLEDVQAFFRTYYHPANASLVLAGDIDTARAFDLADQYFGELTPGRASGAGVGRRRACRASIGSCSRIASSSHASTSRGSRRRCSPPTMPSWISSRTFWPTARRRGSIARWSTSGASRWTCPRISTRASWGASFCLRRRPHPDSRWRIWPRRSTPSSSGWPRTVRPTARWSVRWLKPRRTSCTGCRRSAASAASPISSTPTTCLRGNPGFFSIDLDRYRHATHETVRAASVRHLRRDARVVLSVIPRGQNGLALAGSEPVSVS